MAQQAAVKRTTRPAAKPAKKPKIENVYPFKWEGKDRKGVKVSGELQGTNAALIKAQLRKQGILVTRINKKSSLFGSRAKKIKPGYCLLYSPAGDDNEFRRAYSTSL